MRQISELICRFVGTVDFGADFERQLKFFTLCRGKIRLEHVQVLKRSAKLTANSAVSKVMCQLVVRSDRRKLVATRTSVEELQWSHINCLDRSKNKVD